MVPRSRIRWSVTHSRQHGHSVSRIQCVQSWVRVCSRLDWGAPSPLCPPSAYAYPAYSSATKSLSLQPAHSSLCVTLDHPPFVDEDVLHHGFLQLLPRRTRRASCLQPLHLLAIPSRHLRDVRRPLAGPSSLELRWQEASLQRAVEGYYGLEEAVWHVNASTRVTAAPRCPSHPISPYARMPHIRIRYADLQGVDYSAAGCPSDVARLIPVQPNRKREHRPHSALDDSMSSCTHIPASS
ncbi:uncharacterized protein C8Q71DRAFT_731787 [Rhodofomes roseus]|uniref:Uncharacterized protein n=1 Tax=Rhodofomes roseus TaxID=34475 RepID=A0ABQ8KY32_9APHY|nr:uncharacterized protein C8Q71DRAFT_731787 [Rhodofomes roseus]KAH9844218.1 hypothetical protein C8Q71DRAFT_731787 [Rhodofomes roseus]